MDRGRQVIIRLDASGQSVAEWGPNFGPGLDAKDLVGLAVDDAGGYVLDRGTQRIIRLDPRGQPLPQPPIDLEPLATYGPNGLAADGRGNLYLADTGRDRIVVFDSNGHMTGSIGDAGTELGKFKQPMFVAFGPDSSMLVTDWENARVERFDADRHATNAWPVPAHAWGVAVDALGRVFVRMRTTAWYACSGPMGRCWRSSATSRAARRHCRSTFRPRSAPARTARGCGFSA